MSLKNKLAKAAAGASRFILRYILRRPGAFYPGKIALKIDKNILKELAKNFDFGTILVSGTNGKTSVTALLADCLKISKFQVATNNTGANLASGLVSAILDFKPKNHKKKIGVFEIDELWISKVLPQIQSKYLLLLNLFPDQVDRFGSIENIQKSILQALKNSENTTLIYNADDPYCQYIADNCSNNSISFGMTQKITNSKESSLVKCPNCDFNLTYSSQQYAQLGDFRCPNCGFNRAKLNYSTSDIILDTKHLSFSVGKSNYSTTKAAEYVCYNLTGFIATANELKCSSTNIQKAISAQKSTNGRMQFFNIDNKKIMLNLAKNPVGFNQNIAYIENNYYSMKRPGRIAIAFFVNAREGDGRSTKWLSDVNFGRIKDLDNSYIFYGGEAYEDLKEQLNYSGLTGKVVKNINELLNLTSGFKNIYIIANYTAMFPLKDELTQISNNS